MDEWYGEAAGVAYPELAEGVEEEVVGRESIRDEQDDGLGAGQPMRGNRSALAGVAEVGGQGACSAVGSTAMLSL
jgi:hypothetical protein